MQDQDSNVLSRRLLLQLGGAALAGGLLSPSIARALAIPADRRSGSLADVDHVVILVQENRAFDHYYGTLPGVRGFGDRFTVPMPGDDKVWDQRGLGKLKILPYHLDATQGNAQRVDGTPHSWLDAQLAWNKGRFGQWPLIKEGQSMGYYREAELPFQFALANAFTLCDAYHCAFQGGTNPNRLFIFTGSNDPQGRHGGPAIDNSNDDLGPPEDGYRWTTYAERLEAAGISWKVYQDMDDNFTDNPLEGFRSFRHAYYNDPASPLMKGLSSTLKGASLDGLRNDVLAGALPQVSWIVGPAAYSEHPGPSSPVQGGWYQQQVLDALTSNPEVWSRTVLLITYDENDGFFDHVPPPAPASRDDHSTLCGASTVDDHIERYHHGWPYGPGPRVPMTVVSPWSRGGWVCSQTFDHTSIIRFLEARFGVAEPNISAWRRAVMGDLSSCFDFAHPNDQALPDLPSLTQAEADAIRQAQESLAQVPIPYGLLGNYPRQSPGMRPSRALPYRLDVEAQIDPANAQIRLILRNLGQQAAVFHVYDRLDLLAVPRRYTVEGGRELSDLWLPDAAGSYDLWLLAPNGFHRSYSGILAADTPSLRSVEHGEQLQLQLHNPGPRPLQLRLSSRVYGPAREWKLALQPQQQQLVSLNCRDSARWYDVELHGDHGLHQRLAGRIENGRPSVSDPAMGLGV